MRASLTYVSVRRSGNVARRSEDLEADVVRIGRAVGNEIALDGLAISLQHAEITLRSDGPYLVPRPPATVLLRGRRIDGDIRLSVGDVIRIDRYELRVTSLAEGGYDLGLELEAVETPASELEQIEASARMEIEHGISSRRFLSWLAVGAVLIVCLLIPLVCGTQSLWNPGPISNNHASIAGDCSSCHAPFRRVANDGCLASGCHARIESHVGARAELAYVDAQRCAGCHLEHRGAEGLAALDDATCSGCHAKLDERHETRLGRASDFGADHPEFTLHMVHAGQASLATASPPEIVRVPWSPDAVDVSGLKFNHRKHVGGVRMKDGSFGNLRCDACHILDAGGLRMAPIRFEDHCRSCHPLHYGSGTAAMRKAQAPHGQPGELLRQLRRAYLDDELPREAGETEQEAATRRLRYTRPGQKPTPEEELLIQRVNNKADEAFGQLMSREGADTCGECHTLLPEDSDAPIDVATVALTYAWLGTSRFDHSAHRAVRCGECHPRAAIFDEQFAADNQDGFARAPGTLRDEVPYGLTDVTELQKIGLEPSERAADVLVLGRANCRECHAGAHASPPRVASPCVMCHPYHQPGETPLLERNRVALGG